MKSQKEKKHIAIGCGNYDKEHPELTRSCGDLTFENKIYVCSKCFDKYKNIPEYKNIIERKNKARKII
jgi:ribosomal protein L37E